LGKGEPYPSSAAKNGLPVSFVTGCSMLARLRMIRDVGLMDEGYFLYWEDVDWCVRARRKGWDIAVAYNSLVYHKSSSSVGYGSPLKSYYVARNSIRFIWKLYPWLFPLSIAWWPRQHLLNHIVRGRFVHARMSIRALFDALFRRVIVPQGGQGDIKAAKKTVIHSESYL
jgi:GT2 family glycosyltransferase